MVDLFGLIRYRSDNSATILRNWGYYWGYQIQNTPIPPAPMPLTDVKIRQTKPLDKPFKLADSGGLYLFVSPSGSKLWRYKFRIAGKENVFAIGEYPALSLQDARRARDEARELVKQGINPTHQRQANVAANLDEGGNTFRAIADEWLEKKRDRWTPYYHKQAASCLKLNAYPKIGRLPIRSVTAHNVLDIMTTMEDRGAVTFALQLRQWLSAIFRYAVVTLRAESDPAAPVKGAVTRGKINHAKPMDEATIGDLKARLDEYGGNRTTVIALRLMLYLFVRTSELRNAEWCEFDLIKGEWLIPPERMKKRCALWVPLPAQAIELIKELARITSAGRFLFPNNRDPKKSMSATTINRALEHMGYPSGQWTGHDFRATASTLLNEKGYRHDAIERQLAHVDANATRRAYNHAEYAEERRNMMQDWADWIDSIPAEKVTPQSEH